MNQPNIPKQIASPYATGGGGTEFERTVAAYYLALTLLQAAPRGLDSGSSQEIRFQRRYDGQPLDDLIIFADLPSNEFKLALQVKRDLTFGEKDAIFYEVMRDSWATFKSTTFRPGIERFGIAIGLYQKRIAEHYQSVLTWARSSGSATDFLTRISHVRLSHKTAREFVELIRAKLDSCSGATVSDDELWGFLRSMVILHFDFEESGSRDYNYAVEMLKTVLPAERRSDASNLFARLGDMAAEAKRTAGSLKAKDIREKLIAAGFSLLPAPDCRADLERLRDHAKSVLDDIQTSIGGRVLNRAVIVDEALKLTQTATLLELIGAPGCGKSAILKALAERQSSEGPVIVFAWDRLSGIGWQGFAAQLQLERRLKEILLAIGSASNPCIFIDGIDRISESGLRKVVNDLLRSAAQIAQTSEGVQRWTIVVTAREESLQELHSWLDWRALGQPQQISVPEVSDREIHFIAQGSPHLQPLLLVPQLAPILKNLFLLSVLEDRRMLTNGQTLPPLTTEVEVSRVWWENLVGLIGKDGVIGRARQQSLLNIGKQLINHPGRRFPVEDIPPDILLSLEADRILLRDPGRDVYRFSHDLLEDWVLCRVLDQQRDDLPAYLNQLGQPFGLLRPVQLLGSSVLESDTDVQLWLKLFAHIEHSPGLAPRWRQAWLSSTLLSTRARELLNKLEDFLLTDEAARLIELMVIARTVEINPDLRLLPVAEKICERPEEVSSVLWNFFPIPHWHVWIPFLGWLLERADSLPGAVRLEMSKMMLIWQQKTPPGSIYRNEIAKLALNWLSRVERRH